jgi:hypothetical protein
MDGAGAFVAGASGRISSPPDWAGGCCPQPANPNTAAQTRTTMMRVLFISPPSCSYRARLIKPNASATMNTIRKIKNNILAMSVAAAAMPPKPNTAAMTAITKNTAAQYNTTASYHAFADTE